MTIVITFYLKEKIVSSVGVLSLVIANLNSASSIYSLQEDVLMCKEEKTIEMDVVAREDMNWEKSIKIMKLDMRYLK